MAEGKFPDSRNPIELRNCENDKPGTSLVVDDVDDIVVAFRP